jgi:protein-S-isoprenylcysteine O-methyltransferase Ste14
MAETFHKPRLYPLVWLLIALLAMFLLDHWLPITWLLPAPFHWLGLIVLLPGIIILLQSGASFLKAKTGLLPFSEATTLVTGGMYRFSRNPMYLGMVLFLLGVALCLGSLSALIPVAVYAWIIDRQFIRNEEIFLTGIFGDEFREYMKRVRRWI